MQPSGRLSCVNVCPFLLIPLFLVTIIISVEISIKLVYVAIVEKVFKVLTLKTFSAIGHSEVKCNLQLCLVDVRDAS